MRISRIYLPLQLGQPDETLVIDGSKAHYLRNVLRVKPQQPLNFFTPEGIEYEAKISAVEKRQITLFEIKASSQQPRPASIDTTLIQGISSSDRMDYTIQKAAELGCKKIMPVLTDFCSQKIPAHKFDKKHAHWQAVALSGCEQSGRADLLEVSPIMPIKEVIETVVDGIYLEPGAQTFLQNLPAQFHRQQHIYIGPEGGFSPTELELFEAKKYTGVQIGQRVLRTETVAPVILSALHTLYGDFMPPAESKQ
ncbi:16S rRNA (uracil(1498)-N(3))-methyltransferase [Marinicella sp. S1101]|uniref:16S rRNA (uracil(1498)-N(3))-methyltransferase n=1 Tax=Marinicella marina TaxID=2996016 RepID=UPI00226101E5|nr:16S rRNA (uracil(1498)-N(3))-methyltransferase [Marinicella marina]MCX7554766.1 16S rRNA (uracil(1498)-N(3))-methyltransferase [Marinicella marina]MDJ1141001.1 16S rRNA (uracil(1498)-N(3))-methyltransferase [Marinicella marina]